MQERLKVAIVGTGKRITKMYLPIIDALENEMQVVSVCDENETDAELVAGKYKVPHYQEIKDMLEQTAIDFALVSVPPQRIQHVVMSIITNGVNLISEAPIAANIASAGLMLKAWDWHSVKFEIAENYFRFPHERIKHVLIEEGVFGDVLTAYSDFVGHGYHAVSLIRSYIGWNVIPIRVYGFTADFQVTQHQRQDGNMINEEKWYHAVIEFSNGTKGIYNFTNLSYGSPLRWGRKYATTKFYASKGMCVGHEMAILSDDGETLPIKIERHNTVVDDVEVLDTYIANVGDRQIEWKNPFREYPFNDGQISVASTLMSIIEAIREGKALEYGPENALIDLQVHLAITESYEAGGEPVELVEMEAGEESDQGTDEIELS